MSDDLCMAAMRKSHLPLHHLVHLLPPDYHALAFQAAHPSILSQHTLALTHTSAPLLLLAGRLLPDRFPSLTAVSLRGQPLPNLDSATLFRGLATLQRLDSLDMSDTVWSPSAAAAAAAHLPAAPALRELALCGVRISGTALARLLSALCKLRTLRVLAVSSPDRYSDFAAAAAVLPQIPQLSSVTLDVLNGSRSLLAALMQHSTCQQSMHGAEECVHTGLQWLRCLHINSARQLLSTRDIVHVSALQHLEDLKVATWDPSRHGDRAAPHGDSLMHALSLLTGLSRLDLGMHVAAERGGRAFLMSPRTSQLAALRVLRIAAPCAILGNAFLAGLVPVAACGMREIRLQQVCIGPEGARHLVQAVRAAAPTLEVLQVDDWPRHQAAQLTDALRTLPALTELDLRSCSLDDEEIAAVSACMPSMHALQTIALHCANMTVAARTRLPDALGAAASAVRSLEVGGITQRGLDIVALGRCLQRLPMLRELQLGFQGLKDPDTAARFGEGLAAATGITMLRLNQSSASPHACDSISSSLSRLVNLQRLELENHVFGSPEPGLTPAEAPFPRAIAALTALTALCCVHCTGMLRDMGMAAAITAAAAAAAGRVLCVLRLSCCAIASPAALVSVGHPPQHARHAASAFCDALVRLYALEVLDLSGNSELGDAFALQFAEGAAQMPGLRRVSLARCGVGAPGLRRLLKWLPAAESMQRLQLNEFVVGREEVDDAKHGAVSCCYVG